MKELKNLKERINAINNHEREGSEEPAYDVPQFDYRIEGNILYVFDKNEIYTISYLDEMNASLFDASVEFGFKFNPVETDTYYDLLNEAIQMDLGADHYLDWNTSVELCTYYE